MPSAETAELLGHQARACAAIGSPLYASLLQRTAEDVAAGGPAWPVIEPFEPIPTEEMLGLRFLGAAHRMALAGEAPDLARHFPSVGGDADATAAWPALRALTEAKGDRLRELMDRTIQTNEVGRCAALVGGFLCVARETGLPLRLRELGASAGLLLLWDRYRYESAEGSWGDPGSPVRFEADLFDPAPRLDADAVVADRRGCDRSPLDPASEDDRLTLLSYVWPDMTHRFELLRAALDVAGDRPPTIDRAHGPNWLAEQLAAPRSGAATVVYHSVVMQYLSEDEREEVRTTMARAGSAATPEAPLAWLRFEPGTPERAHVDLTIWPGGEERLLAESGYHGRPVRWRAR
jgi:hypothetical protein